MRAGGLVVSVSDYRPGLVWFNSPGATMIFVSNSSPHLSTFLACYTQRVHMIDLLNFECDCFLKKGPNGQSFR